MNKKTKEQVWRWKHDGSRWRFINAEYPPRWCMARIKDGYRSYLLSDTLVTEEEYNKNNLGK